MFKMEIVLDREILENDGYNWEHTLNLLKENFQRAGFDRELLEDNRMLFTGTDSPKDFAYMGIMYSNLKKKMWFRKCVKEWYLLNDAKTKDGSFIKSCFIEAATSGGALGFTYGKY